MEGAVEQDMSIGIWLGRMGPAFVGRHGRTIPWVVIGVSGYTGAWTRIARSTVSCFSHS